MGLNKEHDELKALSGARANDGGVYLLVADQSEEFQETLKVAGALASSHNAHIALLYALEPLDFQQWGNVEDRLRIEQRRLAEEMMLKISDALSDMGGQKPSFYIREGQPQDILMDIIERDSLIKALVLGAGSSSNPLISHFSGKGLSSLTVPLFIIPEKACDSAVNKI